MKSIDALACEEAGGAAGTATETGRSRVGVVHVGYLHVGAPNHGVNRFGRLLAAGAREHPGLQVREVVLELAGDAATDRRRLRAAAAALRGSDVVHLQYNCQRWKSVWGRGWLQLFGLGAFAHYCNAPLVATLHDLYPPEPFTLRWSQVRAELPARGVRGFLASGRRQLHPELLTLRWLTWRAAECLVCSHEERRRLVEYLGRRPIDVIPHFVEPRAGTLAPEAAKRLLRLEHRRVVTLLGYLHPRKGHELLVRALPHLPADVTAVFAGGPAPGHDPDLERCLALARELGVADRLRVTGYLDEGELGHYLAATDLAVCPFVTASASSSLATWLSAGAPIVASALPLVAEYERLTPGAIRTFDPYTPEALAEAARALLDRPSPSQAEAIRRLRARLALDVIVERHRAAYLGARKRRPAARAAGAGNGAR